MAATPQVSGACGSQGDFYPVSTSCGYRVSCAETLGVDRVSRQVGDASLIFLPSLNDLPEKRTKSELFAGFSHYV